MREKMMKEIEFIKIDKEKFIDYIEKIATEYRNREFSDWIKEKVYAKVEKPKDNQDLLRMIRKAYDECSPDKIEVLLNLVSDDQKSSIGYTKLLGELMVELKRETDSIKKKYELDECKTGCNADVLQLLLAHHPIKEIRTTGLEILISNGIGSGTSDDIGYKTCKEIGKCEFVVTSYLNAQDIEGYMVKNPICPVHGNIFYNNEEKSKLFEKWEGLIRNYSK